MRILIPAIFLFVTLFVSCGGQKEKLFTRLQNTGITFANTIHNSKDFNIINYRNFYNGGGVAIGDINNDGLPDVFFTANMGSNKLYLNKGNFKFEDITAKAGVLNKGKWGTGVVFVDINHDGWLDMYVCNAGYQQGISNENELYINNKNLTFTESAAGYGLNDSGYTTHASFFDYDLDGDLDCYLLKNSFVPVNTLNYANKRNLRAADWPVEDYLKGGGDKLLRNDHGKFRDVSDSANIYGSLIGFGLGVTVGDVNGDHYPDLYISNDFFERDYLYINQKDGTFKEDLENCVQHISHSSMGADIADINNDGYPDIFTTDMLPDNDYRLKTTTSFETYDVNQLKVKNGFYNQYMQNTLQINNRNGKFMETAFYSGVAASDWSWGGLVFDADNDGFSDLFVCNGINNDVTDQDFIEFFANDVIRKMLTTGEKNEVDEVINKMPSTPIVNKAFRNMGGLKFREQAVEWGLEDLSFSNGAAYGDLDNDGDLDLVVSNVNQEAFVYQNHSRELTKNNYIAVTLKGKTPNDFGVGSTISVYQGDEIFTREVVPARGFQSSVDYKIIIGLGSGIADSMTVVWPDRTITRINSPEVNKVHVVEQEDAKTNFGSEMWTAAATEALLQPAGGTVFDKHTEDDYVDFYNERGAPVMLSKEGPKAAVADVNNDGRADVFICGAAGQPGQLYLQKPNGFEKKNVPDFERAKALEDVTALFFDADGDGDADLFVGTGGNRVQASGDGLLNRLYLNDGNGNFALDSRALEQTGMNTCCAVAADFDSDGDQDLFVGSRSVPRNYGSTPVSALYFNDGSGKFTNSTNSLNKAIARTGMISAAEYADITGDGKKELILAGDWMPPRIFSYGNTGFQEMRSSLDSLNGWWRSIRAADLDNDGDQDLVLGNIGRNFYLQPTHERPVKIFINDFEKKGTIDKIITYTVDGKDKPVFMKKELTDQFATLRKQNLKHVDFANKSVNELFSEQDISGAIVKRFDYPASCIAWNDGKGNFTIAELPVNVQLSSVNAIAVEDVNADGKPDLILGGNDFNLLPQFCRLDGSYGHVLLNKGNRHFEWLYPDRSGLQLGGQIRDIVTINGKDKSYVMILQNNETPVLYRLNGK